jgi:hypothetical protein
MLTNQLSALAYSIKFVYAISLLVGLGLLISFVKSVAPSQKTLLEFIFVSGIAALIFHQVVKWWILRSAVAVGYGNQVDLVCACLAIATGVLGYRIFSAMGRYSTLIIVLWGFLRLVGTMATFWRA